MSEEISGKVATVISESQIAINKGSESGVVSGATVRLFHTVTIRDPDTNEPLGNVRVPRINFRVALVSKKYCLATVTDREESSSADFQKFMNSPRKRITGDSDESSKKFLIRKGDEVEINIPTSDEKPPF